jgi:hypothetical protein
MRLRKAQLRACATIPLERRGYTAVVVSGPGVVPGGRLRVRKGEEEKTIAVRTSSDREIGCTRQPSGGWTTLARMDEVIVVVPSRDDQTVAEVFSFDPQVLIAELDKELAIQKARVPDLSYKTPIFVSLDDRRRRSKELIPGIKSKCKWSDLVAVGAVSQSAGTETVPQFIDRVKREYAELNKVDVDRVKVQFSIDG